MDTVDVPAPGASAEEALLLDDTLSSVSTAACSSTSTDSSNADDGVAPVAPVGEVPPPETSVGAVPEVSTVEPTPQTRWVDEVEIVRAEAPTQQVASQPTQFSTRSNSFQPHPEPPAAPAKLPIGPPYRLDVLEQKLRQVEDVMSRFQLLLDVREQAIGRLDDETQRLSAFQGKSKNIVNELRTQMSVMVKLVGQVVGHDQVSLAMKEMSTQPKPEGAFRGKPDSARFRQGGGSGPDYGGQPWQAGGRSAGQRGVDGGNGFSRGAEGGNGYSRGAEGGNGYSRGAEGGNGYFRAPEVGNGHGRGGGGGFRGGSGGRGGRRVYDVGGGPNP